MASSANELVIFLIINNFFFLVGAMLTEASPYTHPNLKHVSENQTIHLMVPTVNEFPSLENGLALS